MSRGLRIRIEGPGLLPGSEALSKLDASIKLSMKRALTRGVATFGGVKKHNERFEQLLGLQIAAANLPVPERQVRFAAGRKFAADYGWPQYRVLVEVQGGIWQRGGAGHSHPMHILRDIEKAQLAVINNWFLFPVTTDQVRSGEALKLIEIALGARGWRR